MFSEVIGALASGEVLCLVRGWVGGTEEVVMEAVKAELSAGGIVAVFSGEERERVHTPLH